ncbi:MAG TPA: type II toxin-antitoxin system VapC family toxin [Allosphingosinicella sp.]
MRAIDTNVAARLIVPDDEAQAVTAQQIVREGVLVPITVVMELGWLLESRYALSRADAHAAIDAFLSAETVSVHYRDLMGWALDRYRRGKPLADMLHIVASAGADSFVTFDGDVKNHAGAASPVPVEVLKAKR